ncbi:MAG TPA: DUF4350 domain-containing protein, partial [Leptolyngbyaceae cyanobacterium M65_K2018_010]|nr:DUF4350 domain-containing protein [Leptolyngbyaceae cyanobacterium M65_K2018_010]
AEENLPSLLPGMTQWLEAGHRLVVLGVKVPVTAAPFSQTLTSPVGPVKIDTRRRYGGAATQPWGLQDPYGAVVWQYAYGAGELVLAATPHLAANAYQDQAGNFALLTQLVAKPGGRVWVDEYLHGYRDEAVITAAVGGATWLHYLARTPVLILASQALVVTLLALLAWNRRLGRRTSLPSVVVDNSQAYIQALAGVLRRAGSHDFVTQTLSQATRQQLQKSLGLGEAHLPLEVLQTAWEQHSGGAAKDLAAILTPPAIQGDAQLRAWLQQLQSLQLGSQETPHGHE